jgi:hypothetical protein
MEVVPFRRLANSPLGIETGHCNRFGRPVCQRHDEDKHDRELSTATPSTELPNLTSDCAYDDPCVLPFVNVHSDVIDVHKPVGVHPRLKTSGALQFAAVAQ